MKLAIFGRDGGVLGLITASCNCIKFSPFFRPVQKCFGSIGVHALGRDCRSAGFIAASCITCWLTIFKLPHHALCKGLAVQRMFVSDGQLSIAVVAEGSSTSATALGLSASYVPFCLYDLYYSHVLPVFPDCAGLSHMSACLLV